MFTNSPFLKNSQRNILFLSVLFAACITSSYAADISFSPRSGSPVVGKTFSVDVVVENNTEPINAISGKVSFPSDVLEFLSVSKTGSIITMWAEEPSFSGGSGNFEGVVLNPGFSGLRGRVLTLTFRAKKAGAAKVSLSSGSILANDGNATNVLGTLGSATFTVVPQKEPETIVPAVTEPASLPSSSLSGSSDRPNIVSSTHADENAWYAARKVAFTWGLPEQVTAVRTLYDDKPVSTPNKVYDPPIAEKTFTTEEDGVMYMHVQFKAGDGWGPAAHRKFQIDTEPPRDLVISLPETSVTTNPRPRIGISVVDRLSGIEKIAIKINGTKTVEYRESKDAMYKLPELNFGKSDLLVEAFDKAGNSTNAAVSITVEKLEIPTILSYTKRVESGGALRVSGKSYPHKEVRITLADEEDMTLSQTVLTNEDGAFEFAWEGKLRSGLYDMTARIVDANGATSDPTEPRSINVERLELIRIGAFIMNWLSLILVIILASMLIIATLWYSLVQFARFRSRTHATMKEAEHTLRVNVQALRRDIEEFHDVLVKTKSKRDLTKEETSIMRKLKKRLDVAEKEIEKKIEKIA